MEKRREKAKRMQLSLLFFQIGNVDFQKFIPFECKNSPVQKVKIDFSINCIKSKKGNEIYYSIPRSKISPF